MDFFCIGQALRAMLHNYIQAGRQTGRSTHMLDALKDGDRVITLHANEAKRLQSLCAERGVKVLVVSHDPSLPEGLYRLGTTSGKTYFDHTWVEAYYSDALDRATRHLDKLQDELSGFGEAHRITQRQAREMQRWDYPGARTDRLATVAIEAGNADLLRYAVNRGKT